MKEMLIFLVITCFSFVQTKNYPYYRRFSVISTATYECIKQSGFNKVGVFISSYPEGFDMERQFYKLFNAYNAGIEPELIVQPCRSRTPQQQADLIYKTFGSMVNKIWLFPHVDFNVQSCQWHNQTDNCQFLKAIISELKKYGKNIGIYSTRPSWKYIFNGQQNCPDVSYLPLFWEPTGNADDRKPNFDSFNSDKFGGWTIPSMKIYDRYLVCGQQMEITYLP